MPTLTKDGYLRIKVRGRYRDWMEHRAIAREAWGPRIPFPPNVEVHHMDNLRAHNCRQNLLILQDVLHHIDAKTARKRRKV